LGLNGIAFVVAHPERTEQTRTVVNNILYRLETLQTWQATKCLVAKRHEVVCSFILINDDVHVEL